jgi:hypothetical protein
MYVMVAAGVIAGDNRDAFLWNKKKKEKRRRIRDFYSTIQHEFNLQRTAPFIRLTPHTLLAHGPHTHLLAGALGHASGRDAVVRLRRIRVRRHTAPRRRTRLTPSEH